MIVTPLSLGHLHPAPLLTFLLGKDNYNLYYVEISSSPLHTSIKNIGRGSGKCNIRSRKPAIFQCWKQVTASQVQASQMEGWKWESNNELLGLQSHGRISAIIRDSCLGPVLNVLLWTDSKALLLTFLAPRSDCLRVTDSRRALQGKMRSQRLPMQLS